MQKSISDRTNDIKSPLTKQEEDIFCHSISRPCQRVTLVNHHSEYTAEENMWRLGNGYGVYAIRKEINNKKTIYWLSSHSNCSIIWSKAATKPTSPRFKIASYPIYYSHALILFMDSIHLPQNTSFTKHVSNRPFARNLWEDSELNISSVTALVLQEKSDFVSWIQSLTAPHLYSMCQASSHAETRTNLGWTIEATKTMMSSLKTGGYIASWWVPPIRQGSFIEAICHCKRERARG